MNPAEIEQFFARLAKLNPHPQGELRYTNAYTLLVAVTLSAQATDSGVNKATDKLFAAIATPQNMLDLGEEGLKNYIKTIGLFNSKAGNLMKMAAILVEQHGGQVPPHRDKLESLPGVGRKTANVVLNIAFGADTIAVDTHLFRLANRTGMSIGKTPLEVEQGLENVIPQKWKHHAHHWLILHGRYVCKARKPLCATCTVRDLCHYQDKTN